MKRTPLKRKTPLKSTKVPLRTKKRSKGQIKGNKRKSKGSQSLAKLKKELDRVFSIYIRNKYPKVCYTCGRTDVTLQCGHFVSRQYLATRWDENNCRPQCVGCNLFGNGKPLDFEEHLKKELGGDFVEAMKLTRHQIIKLDRQWYESEIARYKAFI